MFAFIQKQNSESFALVILRIFELLALQVYKFLKKYVNL